MTSQFQALTEDWFVNAAALTAAASTVVGAIATGNALARNRAAKLRKWAGEFRRVEEGISSHSSGPTLIDPSIDLIDANPKPFEVPKPFETDALSRYYNQALNRANVSFWFSITFASVGFGVIIFAFMTYNTGDVQGAVVKVISGAVIDGVAALFFTQSTAAQRSMAEFFEKLRLDRLNAEAREMISEIEKVDMRDQLRAQLILKYSGVENLLVGTPIVSGKFSS